MKKVIFYLPYIELNTVNSVVYNYLLGVFQEQGYTCYEVRGGDYPVEDTTSDINIMFVNTISSPRLTPTISFGVDNIDGEELDVNFYSFNSTIEALKIAEREEMIA
jgi:hypothetical protein